MTDITATPAPALTSLQRATAFLDGILAGLYTHSSGAPAPLSQPIISDPKIARHILARTDYFVKNYAFLEDVGCGRFSSNGDDWRQRAALTESWYRRVHSKIQPSKVRDIYARHLDTKSPLTANDLFHRFVLAAVEVFSCALDLPVALPWPVELIDRLRAMLKLRQWVAWVGCSSEELQSIQHELAVLREQVRRLWQEDPTAQAFINALQAKGVGLMGFDAAAELLQNLLASSETTASTLLWAAEALSQQPTLQHQLAQDQLVQDPHNLDRFIAEVLRMFPPVPCLTRLCTTTHSTDDGQIWQAGSVLTLSIVGIHRHPDYWQRPAEFDLTRPEYNPGVTPFAYMPFSRGERVCAGMRLAKLELRIALEVLLERRICRPGPRPTGFKYGLSSVPDTSLSADVR
ncbi:MAG: cytochrome P450 [Marinagarivorans sp.]